MRITLFIVLFCVAFLSVPTAFSDSLKQKSLKGEVLQTPVSQDWTGFYTGLILGEQISHSSDKTSDFGYNADNDKWDYGTSGLNAAAEVGYNYSLYEFTVGPEIELGYLGIRGSGPQPASPGYDTVGKSHSNFYTALRARVGIGLHHYLLFVTGGAIGVNSTHEVVDNCDIAPCGGSTVDAKKNGFVWGYTVGGGVEHLLKKDWSVKLEGLYFNLSDQSLSGTTNLETVYDWTGKTSGYIIRGGLNYHF